ncbi:hypothetical protein CHS0354_029959 [Potamilus streckersoni]|uniref:Uncharacterized protein n=1 Tax=Potamilus streckersoni TaxID=2493646 RepID=A0AAE0SYV8_9BIVA|nr:hypothetical protein CHS0354_029959 [Potamilus streckersoni]
MTNHAPTWTLRRYCKGGFDSLEPSTYIPIEIGRVRRFSPLASTSALSSLRQDGGIFELALLTLTSTEFKIYLSRIGSESLPVLERFLIFQVPKDSGHSSLEQEAKSSFKMGHESTLIAKSEGKERKSGSIIIRLQNGTQENAIEEMIGDDDFASKITIVPARKKQIRPKNNYKLVYQITNNLTDKR